MDLLYSNNLCTAFLAEIVRGFQQFHPKRYLGRTAMQKLAYFCQVVGVPIPCSFEIYNYGPYSDAVAFAVESMIADDILEDRSTNPARYSNYRLITENIEFDEDLRNIVRKYNKKIFNIVEALGGFEPQQLELIATLHFIARKKKSIGEKVSRKGVEKEFFKIKRDKFSNEEVANWYDVLESAGLI